MQNVHDRRSTDASTAGVHVAVQVDDPFGFKPGDKIVVLRQIRHDPLGRLHAHRQISDVQYHAGRAYQRDWESAERGARAIDVSKERVDGGRLPDALTGSQMASRDRLNRIRVGLGRQMARVLDAVLVDGSTIERFSPFKTQGFIRLYGGLFRLALDELAVEYGLASVAVQQITR